MTVAELVAWLQTQPPDAIVEPVMHCVRISLPGGGARLEFNYRMTEHGLELVRAGETP